MCWSSKAGNARLGGHGCGQRVWMPAHSSEVQAQRHKAPALLPKRGSPFLWHSCATFVLVLSPVTTLHKVIYNSYTSNQRINSTRHKNWKFSVGGSCRDVPVQAHISRARIQRLSAKVREEEWLLWVTVGCQKDPEPLLELKIHLPHPWPDSGGAAGFTMRNQHCLHSQEVSSQFYDSKHWHTDRGLVVGGVCLFPGEYKKWIERKLPNCNSKPMEVY